MFIKKVAPFAAVVLAGSLLLTGCTSAEADKPASTSSASAAVEVSDTQKKLIDAFAKSQEKMLKDGYTETATDGTVNMLISYDPESARTVTQDSSAGTATYVDGTGGTAPESLKMFLEQQAVTVTEKDGVFSIALPDNADVKLTATVKDGVVVAITSETKGAATWKGTMVYKVTDDAKKAFASATPAQVAVPEGEVVEEAPAEAPAQ